MEEESEKRNRRRKRGKKMALWPKIKGAHGHPYRKKAEKVIVLVYHGVIHGAEVMLLFP